MAIILNLSWASFFGQAKFIEINRGNPFVTPKSGIFLLGSCVSAIAAVGSIFELSSGIPDLGQTPTTVILGLAIPLTVFLFWAAVKDTRANIK